MPQCLMAAPRAKPRRKLPFSFFPRQPSVVAVLPHRRGGLCAIPGIINADFANAERERSPYAARDVRHANLQWPLFFIGAGIEQHRNKDNGPLVDHLRVSRYAKQVHTVADEPEDKRAQDRTADPADAAAKRAAADDRRPAWPNRRGRSVRYPRRLQAGRTRYGKARAF